MEFKRHTADGAKITRTITSLPEMEQVARWHHERFDGKGYPDGLKGNDIPLLVRMVTVADAYDAMTSDRPYRKAKSAAEARAELLRERGRQFDPELDDIMMGIIDEELKDSSPQKLKTVNIGAPACEQR
jgi:putative two-component system response regulator